MKENVTLPAKRSEANVKVAFPSRFSFTPLLSPFLQPLLGRIARSVARRRPQLFSRLGPHKNKKFLIDPVNMPFAMALYPNPEKPRLRAIRKDGDIDYDARITGTFLTLLDMIDGRLDSDALFFSRDLTIEGDTEAIVCLRNALDDLDGSIADDVAAMFGPPGRLALGALRSMRRQGNAF